MVQIQHYFPTFLVLCLATLLPTITQAAPLKKSIRFEISSDPIAATVEDFLDVNPSVPAPESLPDYLLLPPELLSRDLSVSNDPSSADVEDFLYGGFTALPRKVRNLARSWMSKQD